MKDELQHVGIKGMHWGIRKARATSSTGNDRKKQLEKEDADWVNKKFKNPKWRNKMINDVQRDPAFKKEISAYYHLSPNEFTNKFVEKFNNRLLQTPEAYTPSKTKVLFMQQVWTPGGTMISPVLMEVNRIEDPPKKLPKEFDHSMAIESDDFLEHFGIKGMHWGVRNARIEPHAQAKKRMTRGEKKEIRNNSRMEAYNRAKGKDPLLDVKIKDDHRNKGERYVNTILDKMAKNPKLSYNSAVFRHEAQLSVNAALIIVGVKMLKNYVVNS